MIFPTVTKYKNAVFTAFLNSSEGEQTLPFALSLGFYHILGRIPPLLSEAKVGDECRIFYLNY